jgi:hypothetical protein
LPATSPLTQPRAAATNPAAVAAPLVSGSVGTGDLTGCVADRSPAAFAADRAKLLNDPAWFEGPVFYGFVSANLEVLPFRRCPGWTRLFSIRDEPPTRSPGQRG